MLNDRARIILFWLTIGLMVVVAVLAGVTILRACGGLPIRRGAPLSITPPEISLCPGDQRQFAVEGDLEVFWEASGGTISGEGVYTAGESPGDYMVTAAGDGSRQPAGAIVHIVACTPTPTATPVPTAVPTVVPTATEEAEATPSVTPTSDGDPQGDIGAYETGEAIEAVPAGIDVRAASVSPDLTVALQPTDDIPEEIAGWSEEGEAFFWISLYDAVPDQPPGYINWLFVLDVDGNTETGRPAGSRRINPDLGDEVAVGISYNANTGAFEPYSLVWDGGAEAWDTGPDVRYTFGESRTVVGLGLSLEGLTTALSDTAGITVTTESVRGRAAAESYTSAGERVIDFYPELPE